MRTEARVRVTEIQRQAIVPDVREADSEGRWCRRPEAARRAPVPGQHLQVCG